MLTHEGEHKRFGPQPGSKQRVLAEALARPGTSAKRKSRHRISDDRAALINEIGRLSALLDTFTGNGKVCPVRKPAPAGMQVSPSGEIAATIAQFDAWLSTARAGDRFVYAQCSSLVKLTGKDTPEADFIGARVYEASLNGRVLLFQRRAGPSGSGLFSYLAVCVANYPAAAFPKRRGKA